ncbi:MAG: prephenate dehydrogenase [Myxococcota bacterium]
MRALPVFERLTVVGLGLVGGSVALAARERKAAGEIRAVDPSAPPGGDFAPISLAEAARWSDGIVLAVPIESLEPVLAALAPELDPKVILTDTASIKRGVAAAARRFLAHPERCVGAHPMAGGDMSGFTHARADLFEGAACVIAAEGGEPPEVVDRVEQFWQCLGTFTVRRTPEEHDAVVAALSHSPHLIAYAFAQGLPGRDDLRLAGQGVRDFVRIARSNPRLWTEILLRNRQHVAEEVAKFERNLGRILDALQRGDATDLERLLTEGRRALEQLERDSPARSGGER